jgi:hypothetical protein
MPGPQVSSQIRLLILHYLMYYPLNHSYQIYLIEVLASYYSTVATLQETFAARLGRALQGHGNCLPKAVSEPPFIATIAAARADKLSLWSFT